ncbi:MAG: aminopeptidase [Bdellovibrio sp.]|nr:MAG: aminopeptidase [Bdellovibrio sp.]
MKGPFLIFCLFPWIQGCMLTYLIKSSYGQVDLLWHRVPIQKMLLQEDLPQEKRRKLQLVLDVRRFAQDQLHLNVDGNYSSYVEVGRPYVTYIVMAAPFNRLEPYLWHFPFIGSVPYKGFFSKKDAKEESFFLKKKGYDVYVRGTTAYSTLGWFKDPILSTMLSYSDEDLVNVIIHESVHATIFIKGHTKFNESLATYLAQKGTELFFLKKEGQNTKILQHLRNEYHDDKLFSRFLGEVKLRLKSWYKEREKIPQKLTQEEKDKKLKEFQKYFSTKYHPQFKTNKYNFFLRIKHLNNAQLLSFSTYYANMDDFEKIDILFQGDFSKILSFVKKMNQEEDPFEQLARLTNQVF